MSIALYIDVSNCQYQLHKLSHIRLDTWENALIPVPYAKMIGSGKRKKVSARCVLSLVRLGNTKKNSAHHMKRYIHAYMHKAEEAPCLPQRKTI